MAGYMKPEIMGAITTLTPDKNSMLDALYKEKMQELEHRIYANSAVSKYMTGRRTMTMATNYGKSVIHCSLERIENGYLVRTEQNEGQVSKVYYAEDLKAAGEQITALAVSYDLGGGCDDA